MERLKVASLFCGCGGTDVGLLGGFDFLGKHYAENQIDIVYANDIDDNACNMFKENFGITPDNRDIREISADEIPDFDILTGGFPCQSFSIVAQNPKRLGVKDDRGKLFFEMCRILRERQPKCFIAENVKGIMSSPLKHVPLSERDESDPDQKLGTVLDVILAEFDKLGYKTVYGVLDAVNYGVPQFRERFVLIGSRDNEDIFLPIPTHFQMHQSKEYQWQTVRSVIEDLESDHGECATLSEERLKFLKMVPEGGNWRDLPENIIPIAMGGAYKSGGGKVGFYRRLSYDQPSPTVVTSPVQKATMMCHPTQDRPLSVKEYARIQQFPDDWVFTGTTAAKYRQIGNAVPVGLAEAIGKAVLSVANKTALVQTKRFRGTNVHNKIRNAIELGGNLYAVK